VVHYWGNMNDFIIKKRQTYYARLRIPKHLQNKLGKIAFVQSLKTRDIREANIRKLSLLAQWRNILKVADDGPSSALEDALAVVRSDSSGRDTQEDLAASIRNPALFEAIKIAHGDDILLAEHVEAHLKSLSVAPKTLDERRRALGILLAKYSKSSEVDRKSVKLWVNKMLTDKSKATISKMMSTYRVFWTYLEQVTGTELDDPFRDVVPKGGRKTKAAVAAERKAFPPEDILKLIKDCPFTDLKHLITLAAYTGCRIEELCSLKLPNVKHDRLVIDDAKSAAGNREIPIHKNITQLVNRLVDTSTDEYLLSGLTFNMYGDRSNAISKRFGRLKKSLGYDERFVFHSIRKTFTSRLEAAGVPELLAARLLGHEVKTISYGLYSSGSTFPQLKDAINQVYYH
jgi:integrase